MKKIAAIILAAGKCKRMSTSGLNKVVLKLANKQMIAYTVDLLDRLKIKLKIVIVGFAKESVINVLDGRVTIDIAIKNNEKIEAVRGGKILWRGTNTQGELKETERLFLNIK